MWPEIVSNILCGWVWMKAITLSHLGGRWCKTIMLQGHRKFSFLLIFFPIFGFVLLFYKLLCLMSFFNGTTLVMEQNLCYSIFMVSASHDSWRWLVLCFQRSGRMWTKKNYMKLVEEEGRQFLGGWKKLNSNSSNCEVVEFIWILA